MTTEEQELLEVKDTIFEYANEVFIATNKRMSEINLELEKLGVEDEELYYKKFELEEDFETLNTLLDKLDIYELDLLKALIGQTSVYGMEQVMTDTRRKLEIKKIIDEKYKIWLESFEDEE